MQITKTSVLTEVQKGGTTKEIAERLGVPTSRLKEACKAFDISLRSKKREAWEFIDDTELFLTENTVENNTENVEEPQFTSAFTQN